MLLSRNSLSVEITGHLPPRDRTSSRREVSYEKHGCGPTRARGCGLARYQKLDRRPRELRSRRLLSAPAPERRNQEDEWQGCCPISKPAWSAPDIPVQMYILKLAPSRRLGTSFRAAPAAERVTARPISCLRQFLPRLRKTRRGRPGSRCRAGQ